MGKEPEKPITDPNLSPEGRRVAVLEGLTGPEREIVKDRCRIIDEAIASLLRR